MKKLPVGIENFKELMDWDYYYVDKTLFIKELLDDRSKVSLFTRPRRFGKTLALSMLRAFFEDERDMEGQKIDSLAAFDGTKILGSGEAYLCHMGQHPVISLSLKSAKQPDFEMACACLKEEIQNEFDRHFYVLESPSLQPREKKKYQEIYEGEADLAAYATALAFLSKCLWKCHQKKAIILIDEYDVPLENAYFEGFYGKMVGFVRSLFESALKTNDSLEFAVITGCLRISKGSIFTGLNNLKILSVLNQRYAGQFGFTQMEVDKILDYYGLEEKRDEVRKWYDGYLFGQERIYNPWSILNYVGDAQADRKVFPKPYWSNTSSNSIVRELVEQADKSARKEIEDLIAGGTIEKPVYEDVTYGDIHGSQDKLWNFLFFTGYLKKAGERQEGRTHYLKMKIPNEEVVGIYENTVLSWFDQRLKMADFSPMQRALEKGDCKVLGDFISRQLADTISFFDYAENYYHGFLAGLLKSLKTYEVLSNRESGTGRSDLILKEGIFRGRGIILELKVAKEIGEMEGKCQEALAQIDREDYEQLLRAEGYLEILKYGVCFFKKGCLVQKA